MTRDETKEVLAYLEGVFGEIKTNDVTATVNIWNDLFEEYTGKEVVGAIKAYIKNSGAAFAPSPAQLFEYLYKPKKLQQMNEQEAWALVMKAVKNSSYHAREEYEKLPPAVQKAIGPVSQLEIWAKSEDFNEDVQASLFTRTYNRVLKDIEYQERVAPRRDPSEIIEEKNLDALEVFE